MHDVSDEALYDYSVVFYMEGVDKRFEYEVTKGTYDGLRQSLEDEEIGNIVFEAYRPAEQVVVNSRFLQMAHFLWRPRQDEEMTQGVDDGDVGEARGPDAYVRRSDAVVLYFAGRKQPVTLFTDDPEEVFDLVLAMETEAFPRCSIVDSHGAEAVFDLRKLVCAELPLGLAQRGERHALAELEEHL